MDVDDDDVDDDIRMKFTTGTQCPTLLGKVARVLLCVTYVTYHGLW